MEKRKAGGASQRALYIRRQSQQICGVTKLASKFRLNLRPSRQGQLGMLQRQHPRWRVSGINSRGDITRVEMNISLLFFFSQASERAGFLNPRI